MDLGSKEGGAKNDLQVRGRKILRMDLGLRENFLEVI